MFCYKKIQNSDDFSMLKGGPVEKTQQNLNFPAQNWESGFCLVFVWKKNEFLLSSVTQKLRRTVLKKVNTEWQEKKNQILLILLYVENYTYR